MITAKKTGLRAGNTYKKERKPAIFFELGDLWGVEGQPSLQNHSLQFPFSAEFYLGRVLFYSKIFK